MQCLHITTLRSVNRIACASEADTKVYMYPTMSYSMHLRMVPSSNQIQNVTMAESLRYVIPVGDCEKARLQSQYLYKRSAMGWSDAVPKSLDLSCISDVLDVAAGTCAWTLDLSSMTEVAQRLQHTVTNHPSLPIFLSACDINTRFFHDKTTLDQAGITTFQQDVVKPFPADMQGRFDLVHVSLLVSCLTKEGWGTALSKIHNVMKLGGFFLIEETDPVLYHYDAVPPEDASVQDLEDIMGGTGWIAQGNRMYTGCAIENGVVTNLTHLLPSLLTEAGFEVIDTKRSLAPWGKCCRQVEGMAQYEQFTLENMRGIFRHTGGVLMSKGKLLATNGTVIREQEDLEVALKQVEEGMQEEGAVSPVRYCVAVKK
ncbi:hypothetical protein C8Q74DRAFT_1283089 [Fomes fomentarius]|nr:hypothetical protein C8Q74DRAFT_1283089 [Fomes fomentarius]